MSDPRGLAFAKQASGCKSGEREWRCQRVRAIARQMISEQPTRAGRRLEAASAPAAIDVEAIKGRRADDRA